MASGNDHKVELPWKSINKFRLIDSRKHMHHDIVTLLVSIFWYRPALITVLCLPVNCHGGQQCTTEMVHCCTLLQHYEGAKWMPYCHSSRPIGDWENDGSDSSPFDNRFAHCVLWHKVWYMTKVYIYHWLFQLSLIIIIGKWLFYHRYIRVHCMDSNIY